jgi:purine-binding chemotaxis protein CheW
MDQKNSAMADILKPVEQYHRFVTFMLDNERYGIPVRRVSEVLKLGEITPVPGGPASVLGVINVRGVIVTVVDGRRHFNLPLEAPTRQSKIIVLELTDELHLGLLVDAVSEVMDIPVSRIDASPLIREASYVRSVVNLKDGVLILVDVEALAKDSHAGEVDELF